MSNHGMKNFLSKHFSIEVIIFSVLFLVQAEKYAYAQRGLLGDPYNDPEVNAIIDAFMIKWVTEDLETQIP